MKKILFTLTILFSLSQAIYRCNETNPEQYSCYTTTMYPEDPKDVMGIARIHHVNPAKLADYNQVSIGHTFEVGISIIVPNDQCTPQTQQWGCYEVKKGDTLYNIAMTSDSSLVRNQKNLIDANAEILWGNSWTIYEGMHLRLPVQVCAPTWETKCSYDWELNITAMAENYGTTVDKLNQLNSDILAWNKTINDGMILKVPKPDIQVTRPLNCDEDNDYWSCYTTVENDTLWKIGYAHQVNDQLICEQNKIANCSYIQAGQIIAIPKISDSQYSSQCYSLKGAWECDSMTSYAGYTGQWPYQMAVMSNYGQQKGMDKDLWELVKLYNQDRLPKDQDHQYFFDGSEFRVPFEKCMPNFEYTCVPQGSSVLQQFQGWQNQGWFSPMMLYNNWDQGWVPNSRLSDADDYNLIKIPRQSPPNPDLVSYRPEGCEKALYTPECQQSPGVHTCYKVGEGENVYSIAQQFDVNWQALCQFNKMEVNCSCLFALDTYLRIPVSAGTQLD